jgi:threonine dehydrogenase-like Zn-dependent dehydrogenase
MHLDGGLAERLAVAARAVVPVPDELPLDQAAIVADAVATPYHALVERGGLRPGETVAVYGCGGLGYHAVQLARLAGAATVIAVDVRGSALERARRAGADITINAAEERPSRRIRELTGGVDLAVECVGRAESIAEAAKSLRRGGRAVVVGMGPDAVTLPPPNVFTWSEYALIGSFGSSAETVPRLLAMAASGRLDLSQSVTDKFRLEEVNQALELLRSPDSDAVRIVIEPAAA